MTRGRPGRTVLRALPAGIGAAVLALVTAGCVPAESSGRGAGEGAAAGSRAGSSRAAPAAVRFAPGHRIRLQVTSSRQPFYAPNANTGVPVATADSLAVARQTVWHREGRASRLILPVVESR